MNDTSENGMKNVTQIEHNNNETTYFWQTKLNAFDDHGLLSTDLCIYIHATLIALVFIISLIR